MSNEELAALIKGGERDRILELWEQVHDLIALKAMQRYRATEGMGGVEIEDLIQSGYIALVNAVEDFAPGAGYKFNTYLGKHLKTAFSEAGGYRSAKQYRDPLHGYDSLDRPIDGESVDAIVDFLAAPGDPYEGAEHRIWVEQLRAALDRAMEDLTVRQRVTIKRRYYRGETLREIAEKTGLSCETVRSVEKKALGELRRRSYRSGLRSFLDERALDLKTPWFLHVGPSSFNATHTSAVEKIVLQRERDREHMEKLDDYIDAVQKSIERDRMDLARMMAARR